MIIRIDDPLDQRIDVYARLTEHQLRNVLEPSRAVMIAESRFVIEVAIERGLTPLSLLLDERHLASMEGIIEQLGDEVPVFVATREVMSAITGFEVTRGYLCALRRPQPQPLDQVLEGARRVAVLEGIVDVTNVGAIFRSAAALGMDAVLLTHGCADPLYRRAVRVSMGTVFQVPWAFVGEEPSDWPHPGLELLRGEGFRSVAMALDERAISIDDPRLQSPERLAIVLGTEGDGLCARTIADCDFTMSHGVDSLNVAAASAVAFWQLSR